MITQNKQHIWDIPLQNLLERCRLGRVFSTIISDPKLFWGLALLFYFFLVLVFEMFRAAGSTPHGDVQLYWRVIQSMAQGKMPYADFDFEYPPYAIAWFVIPGLFSNLKHFHIAFGIELLMLDVLVKAALIWLAYRYSKSGRLLLPAILFGLSTAANHYFYLQRFDLIPAAISLAILAAFAGNRIALCGVLTAIGIGTKLYPVLFVPPMFLLAWKQEKARQYVMGLAMGLTPLILLSFVMPWWKFIAFHTGRGLQVESLYASLIWLAKLGGWVEAKWIWTKAWEEISSPAATLVLPWARILFLTSVFASACAACWRAWTLKEVTIARVARILLIPLTAFVAFNIVLSPQYLIWLAVLAAVAAIDGSLKGAVMVTGAAFLIPVFYPSPNYGPGLNAIESVILVIRNLLLIGAWIQFMREK